MSPRFRVGQQVSIDNRTEPRHHRVPAYVKGRVGVVVLLCSRQGEPEQLGYGIKNADRHCVYRVQLRQPDLWPAYNGAPGDTIEIEIFEHWLHDAEAVRS